MSVLVRSALIGPGSRCASMGRAQGMLEGVLDVSWTCDQVSVLGAGNDKSIRVWDPTTGRVRHTMTGHTGKVGRCI